MNIVVDKQLILRHYTPEDAPALFNCVHTNRLHLREFLPWVDATLSEKDSLQFIEHTLAQQEQQQELALGIFYNQQLIGGIGMHDWQQRLRKCQIGYWLTKEMSGKGIMTLCAKAFINYLFVHLEMNKVEIQFLPFNLNSGKLAERLGAKTEGVIRASYFIHGSLEDIVIAGILKKEWERA